MRPNKRILITGAAGGIGKTLREGLRGRYQTIRLNDIQGMDPAREGEEVVVADLSDMAAVEALTKDVDAIVHMGGQSIEGPWEVVLQANIIGLYNLYEAARRNGVQRIVFASSNHAVGFCRRDKTIGPDEPIRPDSRYGVSKVFGEAMARLYSDKHSLSSVCLRIGQFRPKPTNVRMLSLWLSPRDMVQLAHRSLEAPDVHFEVVYGISNNPRGWYDNPGAKKIGYAPEDSAEDYAAEVLAVVNPEDEPEIDRQFQGGPFCSDEFDGDLARIPR